MNCNLEENFNRALNLCEQELTHDGLIELLRSGDVAERQFAALTIDCVKDESEARAFISNLTGCDGKIREAVASRLEDFLSDSGMFFLDYDEIFADATIDINANISRMVIDSLRFFVENEAFGKKYSARLIKFMNEAFDEISLIKFRDKKYVLNKQLFKMYWALEGLAVFYQYVESDILFGILEKVLIRPEYTIREKAAQILVKLANIPLFSSLVLQVEADENFYVRRVMEKLKEI